MPLSNSPQNFKQIEPLEILHIHFFIVLQDCVCDYLSENRAKDLQNDGVSVA